MSQPERGPFRVGTEKKVALPCALPSRPAAQANKGLSVVGPPHFGNALHQVWSPCGLRGTAKGVSPPAYKEIILKVSAGLFTAFPTLEISGALKGQG